MENLFNRFLQYRHILKYGLITGIGFSIWVNLIYFFELYRHDFGEAVKYFGIIILFFGVYYGSREKRNRELDGRIDFPGAFKTGIFITIISGILFCSFHYFFIKYINTEPVEILLENTRRDMLAMGSSRETIDDVFDELLKKHGARAQVMREFAFIFVSGIIVSATSAFVLVRSKVQKMYSY